MVSDEQDRHASRLGKRVATLFAVILGTILIGLAAAYVHKPAVVMVVALTTVPVAFFAALIGSIAGRYVIGRGMLGSVGIGVVGGLTVLIVAALTGAVLNALLSWRDENSWYTFEKVFLGVLGYGLYIAIFCGALAGATIGRRFRRARGG